MLVLLLLVTAFFGWHASRVKLSYEFSKAIPTDNPKYIAYQQFRQQFGDEGNTLVAAVQTGRFFDSAFFNDYRKLQQELKKVKGVESVLSAASAINLTKEPETEKLVPAQIFADTVLTQSSIDSSRQVFLNLPFYQGLIYNPKTSTWLMAMRINNQLMASPERTELVGSITRLANDFAARHQLEMHLSGLPLIRTMVADRVKEEMKWFLVGSLALSVLILIIFFRSWSATILSLAVVITGVIWSLGTIELMGYRITLLTALIPPLVVVIGIPNCIYFLNKYHSSYREHPDHRNAIVQMVSKMGVVTLFCNITAAIGFAVFALTKSEILKEFGAVAGINIFLLFFVSLILIPVVLSFSSAPKPSELRYLDNRVLKNWLTRLEAWSISHRKPIYIITGIVLVISLAGLARLKTVAFIVDDLPRTDKIYTDLKFFEQHFEGVMPLEVVVDTKKKYGVSRNLDNLVRIDSLAAFISQKDYIGRSLSITEGLKFAKQAFFEGDSANYSMPSEYDLPAMAGYLSVRKGEPKNAFTSLVSSFMDSSRSKARISASMKDVGSERLPLILDSIQTRVDELFPAADYGVQLTGTSVTFLEGSRYIINGLKESIFWAFLLIALCMLYLFRSFRILVCSLLPNLVPLVITAGVMGWVGVPLKPSTVLVFSVTLGIAIDITIRFLVNYRQEKGSSVQANVISTIRSAGLSIIYTSIVLIAGFVIFCFSGFGGTQALGWLTVLTLLTATIANLTLLPALLIPLARMRGALSQKRNI